ncbi:helix-turn-helix domain-containing protein [Niabella hirudinis]|uniref:helix-turn-helix domain-containing protein n=1 Tax=Niabella hirudinis TaxID=1285929 RepID=UPI003EB6B573
MNIFESETLVISHLAESKLLHSSWKHTPTTDEFISGIKTFKTYLERIPCNTSLWNVSRLNFVISPDLQKWIDQFLNAPAVRAYPGIKAGFVVNPDLLVQLSVNEIFQSEEASTIPVRYFADDQQALEALTKPEKNNTRKKNGSDTFKSTTGINDTDRFNFLATVNSADTEGYIKVMHYFFRHKDRFAQCLQKLTQLTLREKEILRMVTLGLDSINIAAQLSISGETVKTHRKNILRKLDCHNIQELVYYALLL